MTATPESLLLRQKIEEHRDEIEKIFAQYGATNPRLFGSVARGDATSQSDIDLMVDLADINDSKIMRLSGISEALNQLLHVDVDVVTPSILRERVSAQAQKELMTLRENSD